MLLAVPMELRTPAQRARLYELISASSQARRRKRKKRRKKKAPKSSSFRSSSCVWPCSSSCRSTVEGASFHFFDKVVDILVMRAETCTHSANCAEDRRSCRCCSWTVPPPGIGGVGFGSSPNLDTKHTFYEFCLPSERGSCGGGFCSSDGAYDSVWDRVKPMTGKFDLLFPVPRGRWVYLHAELLVQQLRRDLRRQLQLFSVHVEGQVSQ